jgi:hypothetical protein
MWSRIVAFVLVQLGTGLAAAASAATSAVSRSRHHGGSAEGEVSCSFGQFTETVPDPVLRIWHCFRDDEL